LKVKKTVVPVIWMLALTLQLNSVTAQYTLDQEVSFLYINGTSTLHNWTVVAEEMKGSMSSKVESGRIKKIASVQITVPVMALKSGKAGMDQNMYKALKADQFPQISYKLKSHSINGSEIAVTGELTVAGITKIIKSKVTCQNAGKHIKSTGELTLTMSDFGIKPPEFLMGAFKTGDQVSMRFYLMFCTN